MLNVKKSISSLWKARKERLSATRQKPRREKERNWRNIARGRKFSFSRPRKGIKHYARGGFIPTDAQIYEMIGRIEFKFGGEVHTVSEANLLFAYEVGLDLFSVYVIALSENYGAIVFNLPEDVTATIARRLAPDESFREYIFHLIEEQTDIRNLAIATRGFGIGCEAAAEALIQLSKAIHTAIEKPIDFRLMPNNWLKMHGQPMRRKGKGRKKK